MQKSQWNSLKEYSGLPVKMTWLENFLHAILNSGYRCLIPCSICGSSIHKILVYFSEVWILLIREYPEKITTVVHHINHAHDSNLVLFSCALIEAILPISTRVNWYLGDRSVKQSHGIWVIRSYRFTEIWHTSFNKTKQTHMHWKHWASPDGIMTWLPVRICGEISWRNCDS